MQFPQLCTGYYINNYGQRWKNKTIGTETTKLRATNLGYTGNFNTEKM